MTKEKIIFMGYEVIEGGKRHLRLKQQKKQFDDLAESELKSICCDSEMMAGQCETCGADGREVQEDIFFAEQALQAKEDSRYR